MTIGACLLWAVLGVVTLFVLVLLTNEFPWLRPFKPPLLEGETYLSLGDYVAGTLSDTQAFGFFSVVLGSSALFLISKKRFAIPLSEIGYLGCELAEKVQRRTDSGLPWRRHAHFQQGRMLARLHNKDKEERFLVVEWARKDNNVRECVVLEYFEFRGRQKQMWQTYDAIRTAVAAQNHPTHP